MAEELNEQIQGEPQAEPVASEDASPSPEPTSDDFRVSRDEWQTVVGYLKGLEEERAQRQYQQPEEEEEDLEDLDFGQLVERYVDRRMGEIQPYVSVAAEQAGRDQLNKIFGDLEKNPEVGSFDHDLAEKLAFSFFQNYGGDPRYAQHAAAEGAKLAAQMRKTEREEGINEYKKSLSKDHLDDPAISGGGVRAGKKFSSMDDVIAAWTGEEEV